MTMLGMFLLIVAQAAAQSPPPELVAGSARRVSDKSGTTFYATWIPNDQSGNLRAQFFYTVAGQGQQAVEAKPAPLRGTKPIKVSARVPGLKRTMQFEWRAFAGGGDNGSTTVPDPGVPLPGFNSAALSTPGIYMGIVQDTNGVPVGFCKATLTDAGVLKGAFNLLATKYSFSEPLHDDGSLVVSPKPALKTAPRFEATFSSAAGTNRITVTLDGSGATPPFGSWTATLAPTNPLLNATNPAPQAGRYTVLLPIDPAHRADPAFPQGEGYATMLVMANGSVKLVGKLADGTTLSVGSVLDEAGGVALFAPLYPGGRGYLAGRLFFAPIAGVSDAAGELRWVKPGPLNLSRPYDAGFATDLITVVSRFAPLTMAAAAPVFVLTDTMSLEKLLTVPAKGGPATVQPTDLDQLSLKLNGTTGVVTGSIVPSMTLKGAKAPIFGGLLLTQARLGGFFLANGRSHLITTVDPFAVTHTATGLPLDIEDDDPVGVTSIIPVTQPGNLVRCRVSLVITHKWRGDLEVVLTSPVGTTIILHESDPEESDDDLILAGFAVPEVEGEAATGDWKLKVIDSLSGDEGTLESWSLKLTTQ